MRELNVKLKRAFMLLFALATLSFSWAQTPIWEDDFNGTSINKDVWTYDVSGGGMGNGELQYYTDRASNSYISNGNLVIEAKREAYEGNQFTSARLKTHGRFSFKYGIIEARIKLPNLKNGLWPAFWSMGDNIGQVGWPKCGEIDILEAGSEEARLKDSVNQQMTGALHWWHETGTWSTWLQADASAKTNLPTGNFYDDYHTFKMVWDSTHIELWLDAKKYFDMNISAPELSEFRQPQFLILNLAVGGKNYVNLTDPALITAALPAKMMVDYIKVYPINGQTEVYKASDSEKSGKYGIYTETTAVNEKLNFATESDLYIWNNMTVGTGAAYEGSEVLNYNMAAGGWYGMGIMAKRFKNMTKFSDGYLHFYMKTSSKNSIGIGVGSGAGEGFVDLIDGAEQYGLVRDGQWHEVKIPLNRYAVDFKTIHHLIMIKGEAPASAMSFSIDDIYWVEGGARPTPENGNFGVYTDNTTCVLKYTTPTDGNFYVWGNTLTPTTTTPKEGTNVLSFTSAAGLAWFGAAFTPNTKYNLTAFRYTASKLHFDMKTSSTATFKIGIKSGNTPDIGQAWITFRNGLDPYGFVRNGQWQSVDIPMSAFSNVDLSQVSQLFEILGTEGAISDIAIDNIYYTGGGAAIKDGTNVLVTGVSLAPTTISLGVGATSQLTATITPTDATNKTVSYASSNATVASVSSSGLVTAVAAGSATITVTTQDGSKTATSIVTVTVPVTGVTLNPTTATIAVSATSQLTSTIAPTTATNKTVTYSSSNTAIATVSATGLVTGIAGGSATITVTTQDGAKTATCALTVRVPVTGVTLSPATVSVLIGATSQLTSTVAPTTATNKTVTYASSNTAIATVNATGLVTGVAVGSAIITVTTQDGAKTATSTVTVSSSNIPVTGVTVSPTTASVIVGATSQLTSTIAPANATNKNVTWSSSNTAIATVSASGLVTGVAVGSATITVTTQDGAKTASSVITVTSNNTNIALNKPATSLSNEGGYAATGANDGNAATRWSSLFVDPQWIMIDLQANYNVTQVKLNWEAAAGKSYQIQISADNVNWTSIYTTTTGAGGIETLNVSGTGRYIRMYGTVRTTVYGYSLWEFEVYGTPATVVSVTGVTMLPTTANINSGATTQLTATVAPSNATNKTVTWSSSNTAVATVNATGLVTGVASGSATITVTTQDGAKKATCVVTVTTPVIAVTGVSISPTTASVGVGATTQLTATVAPSNATNKTVSFASSNTAIATVSASGLVTGVAAGTATITVTTQDGAKTATCAVTVTSNNTNIALNKPATSSSIEAGYPASNANDGNAATRWSSLFTDPQWIAIDLQANYNISQVILKWEAASGKNYTIQVSSDNTNWTTIKTVTNGVGGTETYAVSGTGRYIRVNCTARNTAYGYSLWEIEVAGTIATTTGCSVTASTGDYSATISADASNPTITFVPTRTGVGATTCILYYGTSATGVLGGVIVTANTAYRITASSGQVIYFYYTYSLPEGGENNTGGNRNSFTVGSCASTLKAASEATEVSELGSSTLEAYPIPMRDALNLKFAADTYQKVVLVDITGKIVYSGSIEQGTDRATVNVSSLQRGTYFVKLLGNSENTGKMLIK